MEEAYSPDIEEFSESEDIFHMSQESNNIALINNGIVEINQKKPKYRPYKKPPKPGGLLEKLRMMKKRRKGEASNFVISNRDYPEQRKIQVVEHSKMCKCHLVSFKFIDKLIIDENLNFTVVPTEFSKFISKHSTYDVVFKLQEREIHPKHFMYFVKFIKAARNF